jgi:hypothetical protein
LHQGDPAGQEGDDGDQGYSQGEAPQPAGDAPGGAQLGVLFGERRVEELELAPVGVVGVDRHPFLRGGQAGTAVERCWVAAVCLPAARRSVSQALNRGHSRSSASWATSTLASSTTSSRRANLKMIVSQMNVSAGQPR